MQKEGRKKNVFYLVSDSLKETYKKNQSILLNNLRAHFFPPSLIDSLESTKSVRSWAFVLFEEEKTYPSHLTELPLSVRY